MHLLEPRRAPLLPACGGAMGLAGSATDRLPLLPLPDMLMADQVSFQTLDLA